MIGKKVQYSIITGWKGALSDYLKEPIYETITGVIVDKFQSIRFERHSTHPTMAMEDNYLIKREDGNCDSILCNSVVKIIE